MKSKVEKLDIGKLETTPVHLSKLSNDIVKKLNIIISLKVDNINTTDLVKNDTKVNEIEKNITDHDHSNKYIITKEFNKLMSEDFAA